MEVPNDDLVLIQPSQRPDESSVITVNCPNQTGFGCDLCRIVLEFGPSIVRGDVSTDGRWCYIVLWVLHSSGPLRDVKWSSIHKRLLYACPHPISYYNELYTPPKPSSMFLLKLCCLDRSGLLHDVTHVLCELELTVHRVKVSTTPDGIVVDLFFVTDGRASAHQKETEDACERLNAVLGESCISCEIQLAGPEYEIYHRGSSFLPPTVAEELFGSELLESEAHQLALLPDSLRQKTVSMTMDNSLTPAHTLLQITTIDQKGLLYDIMRTLKDYNIQISYSRFNSNGKGRCEVDLFVLQLMGRRLWILRSRKPYVLS
ncbi:hypothetical protein AMTRI_Chr08g162920 [Amborella trichopoda]